MTLLSALQNLLRARGLGAYLVPRADVFFGEEVRACDERLCAVSGFEGSAGFAVVRLKGKSLLLVDSRYTLQAQRQVDLQAWTVVEGGLDTLAKELDEKVLAYDPWLLRQEALQRVETLTLVAEPDNLVDRVWERRPSPQTDAAVPLDLDLAGEPHTAKVARILAATQGRAVLITQPDELAWLMNWRGQDLAHSPVKLAFGVLRPDGTVAVFAPEARADLLAALGQEKQVHYDPSSTCVALAAALQGHGLPAPSPIRAAKAVKNAAEIEAMRRAHLQDGKAVSDFLRWFADQDQTQLSEQDLIAQLDAFRAQNPDYAGASFAPICGAGPHGAIVHYRVSAASNRRLREGDLIVLDSGGQYPGATTDVTRTLAVGAVCEDRRRLFTLVLKGMIALTLQQFPVGTTGHQLDVLARAALWNAGVTYAHGTGHGVGAGLHVHEAPPTISTYPRSPADLWALQPGMIVSNEPGYYQPGEQGYGMRCENLLLVVERSAGWLGFETLTRVPFETRLVIWELLTAAEAAWLEDYQSATQQDAP